MCQNVPFAHEVAGLVQPVAEAQNVLGMIPDEPWVILAGILFAIGLCGSWYDVISYLCNESWDHDECNSISICGGR